MELFKRFKKDSTFRRNVLVVGIVLFFLISSNIKPTTQSFVPQPTCDTSFTENSCNSLGCYWIEKPKTKDTIILKVTEVGVGIYAGGFTGCAAGFLVGGPFSPITTPIGCVLGFVGGAYAGASADSFFDFIGGLITSPCYSCIPDGYVTDNNNKCCSGNSIGFTAESITGIPLLNSEARICYTGKEEDKCSSWQKPFSGILDSLWKTNKIESCSTKAYMVMGAVALIFVMVI